MDNSEESSSKKNHFDQYSTQKTLIEQVHNQQDGDAWAKFISIYKPYIFKVVRSMNINHSDCEEITQQVFVKLWKELPKMEYDRYSKHKFRTWLFRLIKNHTIDFIRMRTNRANKMEDYMHNEAIGYLNKINLPEIENITQREWENHLTSIAFESIKSKFLGNAIQAFELKLEGYNTKEIATKLTLKESSVRTLVGRVKESLIQEIKRLRVELE